MRRTLILVSLLAALAVLAAACGGGDDETAAPEVETTATETTEAAGGGAVPASDWANDVCTALGDWQQELTSGAPTIEDAADVENVQQTLVGYLDSVVTATETMIEDVRAAGHPDVDQGEQIAQDFQEALAPVRDSFAQARDDVDALDASDPAAFSEQLSAIGTELNEAGSQAASAFDQLAQEYPNADLQASAQDAPACQSLGVGTS